MQPRYDVRKRRQMQFTVSSEAGFSWLTIFRAPLIPSSNQAGQESISFGFGGGQGDLVRCSISLYDLISTLFFDRCEV
jgi:hypothetical protein